MLRTLCTMKMGMPFEEQIKDSQMHSVGWLGAPAARVSRGVPSLSARRCFPPRRSELNTHIVVHRAPLISSHACIRIFRMPPGPTVPDTPTNTPSSSRTGKPEMPTNPARGQLCSMCPAKATTFCQACERAVYCSDSCKQLDSQHGIMCDKWVKYRQQPGPDYRRAIFFPATGDREPQFIWLRFWHNKTGDGDDYKVPVLSQWFDCPEKQRTTTIFGRESSSRSAPVLQGAQDRWRLDLTEILDSHLLCRPLSCNIHIVTDPRANDVNETLLDLVGTKFTKTYKGPIVAFSTREGELPVREPLHLGLRDFRHILDHLTTNGSTALVGDMDRYWGESFRGVRVHCDGDRIQDFASGQIDPTIPRFEDVRVPVAHEACGTLPVLPIPAALGVSILTAPYPRGPHFQDFQSQQQSCGWATGAGSITRMCPETCKRPG